MKRLRGIPAALALATAALVPSASADIAYISPDGRTIAFVGGYSDSAPESKQIRLVDADCLFEGKPRKDCGRIVFEGGGITQGKIVWATDSSSFMRTGASRLWFRKIDGAGAQPESLYGHGPIDSTVFDPELFPGRDKRPTEPVDADTWEQRISNARGDLIGQLVDRGGTTTLVMPSGFQVEIPREIAWNAPLSQPKYEVGASAWGEEVYLWSASMSERGLLQKFGTRGVDSISVPDGLFGPARPVWDVGTGEPVALLDPFGIYPLATHAGELGWLEASIRRLRDGDQSLEFSSVSLSLGARTAVVRAVQGLTCTRTYVIRPDRAQFVDRVCRERTKDLGAPTVSPVRIPGKDFALKGRLYSWPREHSATGLLIAFHGGPPSNSVQDRPWIAGEALSDSFDILAVDYRGSIGFGWETFTALRQPLSDVTTQDLRSVTDWAASSPAYSGKALGFWGDSWGGYAGALAVTRGITSLDFVVSNSGFIENSDGQREPCLGWRRLLLGITDGNPKKCNGAQLIQELPSTKTPLLMLVGETDLQTNPQISHEWARLAGAKGGCIAQISSAAGGHALQWSEEPRKAALELVRNWVNDALSKRHEACRLNAMLP